MTHTSEAVPRRAPRLRARGAATVLAVCTGSVLLLAGPASAHVKVFSEGAKAGRAATLQFRVPSEKATVTTVRVDVALPEGVRPTAIPDLAGWTHSRARAAADGLTHVSWTARAGQGIEPDSHKYFDVRVAPLPKDPSLGFTTAQTYSDGSVVNWNQPEDDGKEPEFPTPVLVLDAAAAKAQQARPATPSATPAPAVTAAPAAEAAAGTDRPWAPWTVAGAVVLVAIGSVTALRRTRRG